MADNPFARYATEPGGAPAPPPSGNPFAKYVAPPPMSSGEAAPPQVLGTLDSEDDSGKSYFRTPSGQSVAFDRNQHRLQRSDDGTVQVFPAIAAPPKDQSKPERGIFVPGGFDPKTGEFSRLVAPEIIHAPYEAFKRLLASPEALQSQDPQVGKDVAGQALTVGAAALPGTAFGKVARAPANVAPEAVDMARNRAASAAGDLAATEALGVRPFGPAFQQGPMAATARQILEVPLVGAPIKNALDEAHVGLSQAAERVAADVGRGGTPETVGSAVQRGLERFRTAGVDDLEPGVLQARGVAPYAPVQRPDIMSAGQAERQAQAQTMMQVPALRGPAVGPTAYTSRGVPVPPAQTLNQTYLARRTAADLSDQELSTLIRTPAHETSFGARAEALYEAADRMIPDLARSNGSMNPGRLPAANMRQTLSAINSSIANQISGQRAIGGDLAARFLNRQSHFSLDELRAVRTEIGRQIADYNPMQATLSGGQLRQLYGAISRDMEVGLRDLYNRSVIASRLPAGNPARVSREVVERAAGALRTFRTADRYYRMGSMNMDRFMGVVGAASPEQATTKVLAAATQRGGANMGLLRSAYAGLRPEERADLSALLIRKLGTPQPSSGGIVREVGFSPSSFTTGWNAMTPEARRLMFGGPHAQAIENLMRAARRLAEVEKLANHSRSASNGLTVMGIVGGGGSVLTSFATGNVLPILTGVGGAGLMTSLSVVMSRPSYARLAVAYANARSRVVSAPFNAAGRASSAAPSRSDRMALASSVRALIAAAANDNRLLPLARQVASENGIDPAIADDDRRPKR